MLDFIKYYLRAKTKHHIASPFVQEFMEEVFEDDRYYYAFDNIAGLYFWLERYKRVMAWNGTEKPIKEIFKTLEVSSEIGQLLFRMANHYQYKNIVAIENGLHGVWMTQAVSESKLLIIEENEPWANLLKNYVNSQDWKTSVLTDHKLNDKINISVKMPSIDVLILNLTQAKFNIETTFEKILPYIHENSVIILTNKNTTNPNIWNKIKECRQVKLTIDLFQIGFVYFHKEQQEVEHLQLIDSSWKPWSTGFFG